MDAMMRLVVLLGLVVSCVNAACPPGLVASTTIPGKCYNLTTPGYDMNVFWAIYYCRGLTYGADILSIADEFENSEVASLLQSRGISYALIGNAFYDNESHWIASAASSSNYSNWGSGNYNGYAAFITPNGSWSFSYYYNAYSIICQIYPDDPTTFPPPQITCPTGWTPSISVRGKCYQQIDGVDFFSATRGCLATRIGDSHAELVTLTSQLEMMELHAMRFYQAWTSLTRWEADGHWRWVETLHPTDYFGPYGQPSNSEGTCAYLNSTNLYGIPCWSAQAAICQYFPDEPPAPTPHSLNCPQYGTASITKPGTCYYFWGLQQSFQSARSACQALNTGFKHNDLFVPRTLGEYEEFVAIVAGQNTYSFSFFWLGLTSSNGNWGWISGRSSNITNMWCSGQPDTSQYPSHQCASAGPLTIFPSSCNQICLEADNCTDSNIAFCQSTNTVADSLSWSSGLLTIGSILLINHYVLSLALLYDS